MSRKRSALPIFLLCLLGLAPLARAQLTPGQVKGRVLDEATGKPIAGVTVVVQGPAMQGEQTEFTDASGNYQITEIPSGDNYVVRFYYNDVIVERKDIRVSQGKTLTVSLSMPTQKGVRKAYVIKERPPTVDTAGTDTRVEINQEILRNTATRGRTFESIIALAPGAADVAPIDKTGVLGGEVGVSISGSTGNENSFLIDGLNTTDPNLGVIGTQLNNYFIKEADVITGGYQAEYGRATGGVVSIVTKTGSNEFHGGIFGSVAPYQAEARTVARLGEALATRTRSNGNEWDFGFDLGGPIIKDRLWFYLGFAPTLTTLSVDRISRNQTLDPMTGRAQLDTGYECPGYLSDPSLCNGPKNLALRTNEVSSQGLTETRRRYNWITKLQYNINPDHNITLSHIGAPELFDGYFSIRNDLLANKYTNTEQVYDVTARYVGKFLERRLQVELMYGYHYQKTEDAPASPDKAAIQYLASSTNPYTLADFENVPGCRRTPVDPTKPMDITKTPMEGNYFNPCPLTTYSLGGFGYYHRQQLQRHVILAAATYFLRLNRTYVFDGTHALKLGFDFEDNLNHHFRTYSGNNHDPRCDLPAGSPPGTPLPAGCNPYAGHRFYQTGSDGNGLQNLAEYGQQDLTHADGIRYLDGFTAETQTRNFALYLRDSWNFERVPGLVLNLGVRWEAQQILAQDGAIPIAIYDNWAPRVGLAYDFTRKGRSRISFNYGRFYESIPMDINDRQFSGEGVAFSSDYAYDCKKQAYQMGGRPVPISAGCSFTPNILNGGTYGNVIPNIRGQFINEIVAGFQYDVGFDIVLGVNYTHRDYGNIIEDMSTDGGSYYIIGNPGSPADPGAVSDLQKDIGDKQKAAQEAAMRAMANPSDAMLKAQADTAAKAASDAVSRLNAYKAIGYVFPQAKRNYDALTFTANKRLSNRFSVLASYTYSRLIGNYPGTYSSANAQVDPNISTQFDLVDLLANHNGPLPNDRPHNVKLTGFYVQPVRQKGSLTAGLTFTLYSGRPIEVLGYHPYYNNREVFILPRGSGGRTPVVTQFDLHLAYEHQLSDKVRLNVFAEVVNLFNQREVTNVDDEYTTSSVAPIRNGKLEDLKHLKTSNGTPLVLNSNYGVPTGYQAPLYLRFGASLAF